MDIFNITRPFGNAVPVLISSPHSGTFLPPEIRSALHPELAEKQDDADWFIDKLYDFAPDLGITLITANYSRWVIDLNRNPENQPLYADGRVITGLVPFTNFNGDALYRFNTPDRSNIDSRIEQYYKPYHKQIETTLKEIKAQFGIALLFDAHSIRKKVPGIQQQPFPDLILGDNDKTSAGKNLIKIALDGLCQSSYDVSHNHPFKGGHITRSFGDPNQNIHALQLEMAKINYMDDSETRYDFEKADAMQEVLKNMFSNLIAELKK